MDILEAKQYFEDILCFKVKQYQYIDLVMFYAELNASKIKIFYDKYRGFFIDINDFKYETTALNTEYHWNHLLSNLRKDRDLYALVSRSIVDMELEPYDASEERDYSIMDHFGLTYIERSRGVHFEYYFSKRRYRNIDVYGVLNAYREYIDYISRQVPFTGISSDGRFLFPGTNSFLEIDVSKLTYQYIKENGNPFITQAENNETSS